MKQYCPTVTVSTSDVTYQIEMYPLMLTSLGGLEKWEAALGHRSAWPVRIWRWLRGRRNYLTYKDDPVLAKLWDNEEDSVYGL